MLEEIPLIYMSKIFVFSLNSEMFMKVSYAWHFLKYERLSIATQKTQIKEKTKQILLLNWVFARSEAYHIMEEEFWFSSIL